MPGQFARLILILHAVKSYPLTFTAAAETVTEAAELITYFKAHARRVYRHLMRERQDLALKVLMALKVHGPMKQSELLHNVFRRNVSAERLRTALEGLESSGLVARSIKPEAGRQTATVWSAL